MVAGIPPKLKANFDEIEEKLGIDATLPEDQTKILEAVLLEITPDHYIGHRPPEKSYEDSCRNAEMFAFEWQSGFFRSSQMYFKFALNGRDMGRKAFVFSIHPCRDPK